MGRYDEVKSKNYTGVMALTALILVVAGIGWFYFNQQQGSGVAEPDQQALSLPPAAQETLEPGILPEPEATEDTTAIETIEQLPQDDDFVLPDLLSSDALLRDSMIGISPKLEPWLHTDQLIRKYVVIANDFSQGLRIEKHMRFLKPAQPFAVTQDDPNTGKVFIADNSYQRFDELASAIDAMDVQATLAVYKKFRPLMQQVYAEFGYPEAYSLEDIFTKAAAEILAAPVIEEKIALVRPSVQYKFADSKLEALSPVRKQMLRMGPKNTRIIQNKIRLLVEGLVNLKD